MAKPPIPATLTEVRALTPTVKHFRFAFGPGIPFDFKAGQFLMLHVPRRPLGTVLSERRESKDVPQPEGQPALRRAYSICSPPHEHGVAEIVVKYVEGGAASSYLFGLQEGNPCTVDGPYGAFVLPTPPPQELVFVCTGTGIAPFRAQIQTLFHQRATVPMTLLFGVRYEDEVLYDGEWRDLAVAHRSFRYVPTISRPRHAPAPWAGEVGYVQTKLAQYAPPAPEKAVYICGLWDMISAVENTLLGLGYTKPQIHYERYD